MAYTPVFYRGFELMEQVCVYPSEREGEVSIAVYDADLGRVVSDQPTISNAKVWIDVHCIIADRMLASTLGKRLD